MNRVSDQADFMAQARSFKQCSTAHALLQRLLTVEAQLIPLCLSGPAVVAKHPMLGAALLLVLYLPLSACACLVALYVPALALLVSSCGALMADLACDLVRHQAQSTALLLQLSRLCC